MTSLTTSPTTADTPNSAKKEDAGTALTLHRAPPHNFEAEQALLSSLMHNNLAAEKVDDFLRAEHFADPLHGRIFAAIMFLIERGKVANPITLKEYFEKEDK